MPKPLPQEVLEILAKLPPDFFGSVEIAYRNGVPGVVKVVTTTQLKSQGENPGSHDRNNRY